ncbi:Putative NAD(P)H nitroreductase RV3131/MT3217 [Nocardia africana]|uniref:NAD(P)H nitroreductase RV3131/MT3217 n=2 Tax=Nocardia africana TaxID=134964 RepID=A0A378WXA7_9NOCA|nr:Putative NAD(P)H nitroreductase RV3131/MT3217 [Nocardia africana]
MATEIRAPHPRMSVRRSKGRTGIMTFADPFTAVFADAVEMAVRAPSVHNTQPWRWSLHEETIHLHADESRQLTVTDPAQRALLLSCGTALHHMRVALAMLGWSAQVTYLPDDTDPDHLAAITMRPRTPSARDIELAAAIAHRQSDRRRYSARPVPQALVREVSADARAYGAAARQVPPELRPELADAARVAAVRHAADPAYLHELAVWSGRHGTADGVPAANTPAPRPDDEIAKRRFESPELADPATEPEAAEWLVVCTTGDDRLARLRAGEAVSALLLSATTLGLSSSLQSEPLALPDLRAEMRRHVLSECAYPQTMVRMGWLPSGAAPLPHTPRRPVTEVIAAAVAS